MMLIRYPHAPVWVGLRDGRFVRVADGADLPARDLDELRALGYPLTVDAAADTAPAPVRRGRKQPA